MMGTGVGHGEHRAVDAAQKAIASPLLDDTSIEGAKGILINFTGGRDLSIHEVEEAARIVHEAAHEDANIIFGAVIDPSLHDELRITVIATGFSEKKLTPPAPPPVPGKVVEMARPVARPVRRRRGRERVAPPRERGAHRRLRRDRRRERRPGRADVLASASRLTRRGASPPFRRSSHAGGVLLPASPQDSDCAGEAGARTARGAAGPYRSLDIDRWHSATQTARRRLRWTANRSRPQTWSFLILSSRRYCYAIGSSRKPGPTGSPSSASLGASRLRNFRSTTSEALSCMFKSPTRLGSTRFRWFSCALTMNEP